MINPDEQLRKARHVEFTKAYTDAFLSVYSKRYVHMGALDGKCLKEFLISAPDVTKEEWSRVAEAGMRSKNEFVRSQSSSIRSLTSSWNRILGSVGEANTVKPGDGW